MSLASKAEEPSLCFKARLDLILRPAHEIIMESMGKQEDVSLL